MGRLPSLIFILPVILICLNTAFGHGDEDHSKDVKKNDHSKIIAYDISKEDLDLIALKYEVSVKPIFQKKCYDCHGSGNKMPWYYIIPGVKQFMDSDMVEAKKHMDMTEGFPFSGHGTPSDDLTSIRQTLKENTMPPKQYLFMHWRNSLTSEDKKIINAWINIGLTTMNKGEIK